ncbi:hypothetical protein [Alteribacillus sp. YIM 98480]|uniref:hypothetical protein n=1 Tax=Alteribacillus sp. YIM 98480 TaxID=2606599 RepID=UPI00131DBB9A|nr:hypothetical protein [Alteribacillus sp. YIM 98480]
MPKLKTILPYLFLLGLVLFMYFFKHDENLTPQESEAIDSQLQQEEEDESFLTD